VALTTFFSDFSIKKEIQESVTHMMANLKKENVLPKDEKDARQLQSWIEQPELLSNKIYNWLPAGSFLGIFVVLWCGLFIILRNKIGWQSRNSYPYNTRHLIEFKVPDFFIWILIFSLLLILGGGDYLTEEWGVVGMNLLYCVGIFYLFQGFGVYMDFLSSLKIYSVFKSLLVILILLLEVRILAILGILDYWINIRRFFNNKNNKNNKKGNIL
ncbi:MAG: DUF2232 domain-containing protein, partial [Halobacteriovoraceae bacterium]|nr:DUF2232 domain-containing protein [Halobacteriovoraceae bacterium]